MNNISRCLAATMIVMCQSASSQSSGGDYTLLKHSISPGGGVTSDNMATYRLTGTIGQIVASQRNTINEYSLTTGFWQPLEPLPDFLFSDSFETSNRTGRQP